MKLYTLLCYDNSGNQDIVEYIEAETLEQAEDILADRDIEVNEILEVEEMEDAAMTHNAETNKSTIMGSLVTLGAYYHEECDRAMDKKDTEKALEMIKLEDAVMTLLEDMQERFF